MLDHLAIQCDDLDRSAAFYDAVTGALGGGRVMERGDLIGYGSEFPVFWIGPHLSGAAQREVHIALRAASRDQVQLFHDAALALDAEILHPPQAWPQYHDGYFGAFVRDPDGNNVEAVHHTWPDPPDATE